MHALAIFLGAFLVFQVQPLVGKFILPWFGGTPGVWTTCLLFFQAMLLAGYGYAHLVALRLKPKTQAAAHGLLLLASLALLPITPSETWKITGLEDPTWQILALLLVSVGAPYVLASSTAPLIQAWFAKVHPGRSPYRLYSLSNVGALLALLTYPTLVEPSLRLETQSWLWSTTYLAFVSACAVCAWKIWRLADRNPETTESTFTEDKRTNRRITRPVGIDIALWLTLSACGSIMLMATTNRITQDVAAVPFLWIVPLALYLISFIVCFDHERWYHRGFWTLALIAGIAGASILPVVWSSPSIKMQIALFAFALLAATMACHGELVKARPAPRYLTWFYLTIAAGGALGGVFVAIIAPAIFDGFTEYPVGLVLSGIAVFLAQRRARQRAEGSPSGKLSLKRWSVAAVVVVVVGTAGTAVPGFGSFGTRGSDLGNSIVVSRDRNFFGVLTVSRLDVGDAEREQLVMSHGTTTHGSQYASGVRRTWPTTYYSREAGIGVALENHPRRGESTRPMRIGVIGLGVGTIAAYGRPGDQVTFYEINPDVIRLAREHFSFLADAEGRGCRLSVLLGDARILLEQQLDENEPQQFDLLVVDAFSSDAIPVHLLTRASFAIYRQHLAPDGVLAVHVSNNHLDLEPVVRALAADGGDEAIQIVYRPPEELKQQQPDRLPSDWMLVTRDRAFLDLPVIAKNARALPGDSPRDPLLWTDDFSSLLSVLR